MGEVFDLYNRMRRPLGRSVEEGTLLVMWDRKNGLPHG